MVEEFLELMLQLWLCICLRIDSASITLNGIEMVIVIRKGPIETEDKSVQNVAKISEN